MVGLAYIFIRIIFIYDTLSLKLNLTENHEKTIVRQMLYICHIVQKITSTFLKQSLHNTHGQVIVP